MLPLWILEPFFTLHYHFDAHHLFSFPFTSLTKFVPLEHHKVREVGSRWDCGGYAELMRAEVKRWKFACVGCAPRPFYYWYDVFGLLTALCQTWAFILYNNLSKILTRTFFDTKYFQVLHYSSPKLYLLQVLEAMLAVLQFQPLPKHCLIITCQQILYLTLCHIPFYTTLLNTYTIYILL